MSDRLDERLTEDEAVAQAAHQGDRYEIKALRQRIADLREWAKDRAENGDMREGYRQAAREALALLGDEQAPIPDEQLGRPCNQAGCIRPAYHSGPHYGPDSTYPF